MADRVSLRDVEATFARFVTALGSETSSAARKAGRPITGTYELSVQRLEGYRIRVERVVSETGGVTGPFGYRVRNCPEMDATLRFALDVLQERERIASADPNSTEMCETCVEDHTAHMPDDGA